MLCMLMIYTGVVAGMENKSVSIRDVPHSDISYPPNIQADILDQQQIEHKYVNYPPEEPYYAYVIDGGISWAQSFIPTIPILTRIKLLVGEWGDPSFDLVVSIRSSLDGSNLATVKKSSNQLSEFPEMTEFDFPDISVTPGQTYYIVCEAPEGDTAPPMYGWAFGEYTSYTDGEAFRGRPNQSDPWGSSGIEEFDFIFETYGSTSPPDRV